MSTSASSADLTIGSRSGGSSTSEWLRAYFWSDNPRRIQTVLGLIWLVDGGLQFQSFMYSGGFVSLIKSGAAGQPGWVHDSIIWGANIASHNLGVWNSLFALTQVVLGFGLLYRPTVRAALVLNVGWALFVWWFGEGFGAMLIGGSASPLSGAPGCVTYVLVGLVAWPSARPGGLLGARGARTMWAALWLIMAWLWLESASAAPDAIAGLIGGASSGMGWLSSLQNDFVSVTKGNGVWMSLVLAALSATIGIGVAANWRARQLLWVAAGLYVVIWVVGQGFGGIFAGGATDPNTAPLFVLLAWAMYPVIERRTA